ncbi:non-canonical purine NTP pyrophosphatase [Methylobacterium sp. J-090]|uniref:non-canonical purine NTP pyrophosphatase n=1 Tax=Methylobacterium sp. J-090 TaxID=2836666 RepID=UPI001FBB4DE9|nr:non-canonical purine NTP pyrophosphatase [Methylobacterium sp. J-090]MCJ2080701.1 hypothetical protein [Methylobacterium sp. J-090]
MKKINVYYATKSDFKKQEINCIIRSFDFRNEMGIMQAIGDRFNFVFSDVKTDEPLEVNLETMVRHKAVSAYKNILMPCIVEHAGLIFDAHRTEGYPGGLTQPMMDSLGPDGFLEKSSVSGQKAVARAVIGYCDGMSVRVFVGETEGVIVGSPMGSRDFYWDTIFSPDSFGGETYAQISGDPHRGLIEKMRVSQSLKALQKFLEHRVKIGANSLFSDFDG